MFMFMFINNDCEKKVVQVSIAIEPGIRASSYSPLTSIQTAFSDHVKAWILNCEYICILIHNLHM